MKGCYVYCCDKPLAEYLAAQLEPQHDESIPELRIEPEVNNEVKYIDFLPLYSIRAACGYFGEGEMVDESGWMKVVTPSRHIPARNHLMQKETGLMKKLFSNLKIPIILP